MFINLILNFRETNLIWKHVHKFNIKLMRKHINVHKQNMTWPIWEYTTKHQHVSMHKTAYPQETHIQHMSDRPPCSAMDGQRFRKGILNVGKQLTRADSRVSIDNVLAMCQAFQPSDTSECLPCCWTMSYQLIINIDDSSHSFSVVFHSAHRWGTIWMVDYVLRQNAVCQDHQRPQEEKKPSRREDVPRRWTKGSGTRAGHVLHGASASSQPHGLERGPTDVLCLLGVVLPGSLQERHGHSSTDAWHVTAQYFWYLPSQAVGQVRRAHQVRQDIDTSDTKSVTKRVLTWLGSCPLI